MTDIATAFADIAAQLKTLGADDAATQAALATIKTSMTDADARLAKLEAGVPPVDLSGYALKTDIPAAPDLSGFALKSDIPAAVDTSALATKADLDAYLLKSDAPAGADLSDYALKSDLASVAHQADLDGLLRANDLTTLGVVHQSDLAGLAKSADLAATAARVGIIEAGIVSLDVSAFDRASNGDPGNVVVVPVTFPVAPEADVDFSVTLSGTGGAGPYVFTVQSGALPDGLSLAAGGAITGVPTKADPSMAAPWSVVVAATDANNVIGLQTYTGQL